MRQKQGRNDKSGFKVFNGLEVDFQEAGKTIIPTNSLPTSEGFIEGPGKIIMVSD